MVEVMSNENKRCILKHDVRRDPVTGKDHLSVGSELFWYDPSETLESPEDVATFMQKHLELDTLAEEQVFLLAFDVKNQPIGYFQMSKGTVDTAIVTPRDVFMCGLLVGAVKLIMIHNHPSGDPTPSGADVKNYKQLTEAGNLLGVMFLDSIITGDHGSFVSIRNWTQFTED